MKKPTQRQAEAIALLAQGASCKEVARQLGVAVTTAQTMLAQARERVGAKTVAHLVALSITHGFIRVLPVILCAVMLLCTDDGMRRNSKSQRMTRREAEVQIYA